MPLLLVFVLVLLAAAPFSWNHGGWRPRMLRASILLGVLLAVITEFLGWLLALTFWGLTAAWGLVLLVLAFWIIRRGGVRQLPKVRISLQSGEIWLLAAISIVILAAGLTAVFAPVQTPDSLSYHMSRVAHWAQNRSVDHFATGIERQLYMSPLSEYGVLHVFILGRSDAFVNLPNWFAFIGLAAAASWIAACFGAGRSGQFLAGLFAVAVPIAIAQASSTATDLLTAFWVVCLAAEVLALVKKEAGLHDEVFAGLAAGLAVLTKPTGGLFALPLLGWAMLSKLQRKTWPGALRLTGITLLAVVLLNAGIFSRNFALYGNPLGPQTVIRYQANQIFGVRMLASNVVRNLGVHLGTIGPVNRGLTRAVEWFHELIRMDPADPRTSLTFPFVIMSPRNEDMIGNLVPLLLFLTACIGWIFMRRSRPANSGWFLLCLWAGFLLYSLTNRWQLFATRLQLPFFMLAAPLSAVMFERILSRRWLGLLAGLVFLSALPWSFCLFTRPLVPVAGWTDSQSILVTDRNTRMYTSIGVDPQFYQTVAEKIRASGCNRVQWMLHGDSPEYLWWKVLDGGVDPDLKIEWRVADTPSARFSAAQFDACAAIIDDRIPNGEFPNLQLALEHNGVFLLLK